MSKAASNTSCVVSDLINSSVVKRSWMIDLKIKKDKKKHKHNVRKTALCKKNGENVSSCFISQTCFISSVPLEARDLVSLDDHHAPSVSSCFNILEGYFDNIIASPQTY